LFFNFNTIKVELGRVEVALISLLIIALIVFPARIIYSTYSIFARKSHFDLLKVERNPDVLNEIVFVVKCHSENNINLNGRLLAVYMTNQFDIQSCVAIIQLGSLNSKLGAIQARTIFIKQALKADLLRENTNLENIVISELFDEKTLTLFQK
jgi:hypothetical protein